MHTSHGLSTCYLLLRSRDYIKLKFLRIAVDVIGRNDFLGSSSGNTLMFLLILFGYILLYFYNGGCIMLSYLFRCIALIYPEVHVYFSLNKAMTVPCQVKSTVRRQRH